MTTTLLNPGCDDDCYDCIPVVECEVVSCNDDDPFFAKVMKIDSWLFTRTIWRRGANSFSHPTISRARYDTSIMNAFGVDPAMRVPIASGGPFIGQSIPIGRFKLETKRAGTSNIPGHVNPFDSQYYYYFDLELVFKEFAPGDNRWHWHRYNVGTGDAGVYEPPFADLATYPYAPYTDNSDTFPTGYPTPFYAIDDFGSMGSGELWTAWTSPTGGNDFDSFASIINCGSGDKAIRWKVPSDTTEAWLIRTCPSYAGSVETRIDIDLSNGFEGLELYDPSCSYALHGSTPRGEGVSNCCECTPAPSLSFEIADLTDEFASLNGVYAVDLLDDGTIASGTDSIHCEPDGPTSAIAYSIITSYTYDRIEIIVRLDEEYDGTNFRLDIIHTIDLDPDNTCVNGKVSFCNYDYHQSTVGSQNPNNCYSTPFTPSFTWL